MAGLSGSDILQIGDEDGEFSRKSAASFRFDSVAVSGRGTLQLATVETIHRTSITSVARELRMLPESNFNCFI